jgi:Putative Flp pilus-assembly TadE/G-like
MQRSSDHLGGRQREGGVIVVMFSLLLVVLLAFGALVYTGAQALVLRRQLQNAGDAAALAAANLILVNDGCSAAGDGGPPRASIVSAAKAAVATNFPGYDLSKVTVSCPTVADGLNHAVKVDLSGTGPSYFGFAGLGAATTSTAVNGQVVDQDYAVILLDPMNLSWPSQRNGCPSFTVNGGITLTFEKKVIVDSKCTLADNNSGAVKALNASFQMNFINGAEMRIAGEYAANTLGHINPTPTQHFRPLLSDPLSGLQPPLFYTGNGLASLPDRDMSTTSGLCKNQDPCILPPGTYTGGMYAQGGSGPSTILLRPGVYYIGGGGLKLKSASARVIAIPDSATMSDTDAKSKFATTLSESEIIQHWEDACPLNGSNCGVMVYNAPSGASWVSNGGSADEISNGSQGVVLLRAYNPAIDEIVLNRTGFETYRGLVIWQARTPVPTQSAPQPVITMAGGACVIMSGTVYAAGGQVVFGGSSCGSGGGGESATTLQFVVFDLTLSGNNNFYFAYQKNLFAAPMQYGLIN